jgi:hypothetical protein
VWDKSVEGDQGDIAQAVEHDRPPDEGDPVDSDGAGGHRRARPSLSECVRHLRLVGNPAAGRLPDTDRSGIELDACCSEGGL